LTKIIGHRGFSSKAPENSLSALELAILQKCDYFEIDVQSSKDNVPYVLHDKTLDRTSSNFSGLLRDYSSLELNQCLIGFPDKFGNEYQLEPLPTLEQALVLAKNRIKVCVELKDPLMGWSVYDVLNKLEMLESVVIFSFHKVCLLELQRLNPYLKLLYLTEHLSQDSYSQALELNAIGIGISASEQLTAPVMRQFYQYDLECWVWTVNELAKMEECFKHGVHGIITDYPDLAKIFSKE